MPNRPPLVASYWPASDDQPLVDSTCGDALREAAGLRPDAVAVVDTGGPFGSRRRWTYRELLTESEQLARSLAGQFPQGTHVAVFGANSPEWVIAQFALALSGLVMVTVNPALGADELAYILRQSRSRGIFYQSEYRGVDMRATIEAACDLNATQLDFMRRLDQLGDLVAEWVPEVSLPTVDSADPAMIQYTSGTTGNPKGAELSHYSVTNNSRFMAILKEIDETTVNLAVAPLFHTAGCVANVLGSVQSGSTMLLPSAFTASSMLDLIAEEGVTFTFGVPTMLIALLAEQEANPRDLSSLKTVFSGAATVPVDVVRRVEKEFDVSLVIGYGQTETSPAITHTRLDDTAEDKSETIGYAIPQVEIKIIDTESGKTLPVGEPGELCTRGFNVMLGYYDNPEATRDTIDSEGWLHTGDLCVMDERGYCRITGRLRDLIIRGGENIYPREIEEVLYAHPAIAEVAVIGIRDDYWGEEVGAVMTLAPNRKVSGETLREYLGGRLAKHKIPQYWFAVPEIPSTASGKVQKFKLVELAEGGELDGHRV
ncbi:MAG: AMP-binding protein [Acidimicrobiia bacterium]|nr:AMP-binding protein [Acidimicrobiia bacterium]